MRHYNFQVDHAGCIASISIDLVGRFDPDFLEPRIVGSVSLDNTERQELPSRVGVLMDAYVGIFNEGTVFSRVKGDVGVIVRVRHSTQGPALTVDSLHAELGRERAARKPKRLAHPESAVLTDSKIVSFNGKQYSYVELGTDEATEFSSVYSSPLMDGYYLQFIFNFTDNNFGKSPKFPAQALTMIEQMMQSASIQILKPTIGGR